MAAPVVLAALAEREPIAVQVAPAAVALPDRAARVALVLRAPEALAALAVSAALAGMRVVSATAPLVVMPAQVAVVAWVELRARLAQTLHRWLVAPAGRAAMPGLLVMARRVSAA